jgi:hypothetical protein
MPPQRRGYALLRLIKAAWLLFQQWTNQLPISDQKQLPLPLPTGSRNIETAQIDATATTPSGTASFETTSFETTSS